jgi:hypothetical protein
MKGRSGQVKPTFPEAACRHNTVRFYGGVRRSRRDRLRIRKNYGGGS